jgi:hypothetical protein
MAGQLSGVTQQVLFICVGWVFQNVIEWPWIAYLIWAVVAYGVYLKWRNKSAYDVCLPTQPNQQPPALCSYRPLSCHVMCHVM